MWVMEIPSTTPVGYGDSVTHTLWVMEIPSTTPVGYGDSVNHARGLQNLRKPRSPPYVGSVEPTYVESFIFGGLLCSCMLADSPRFLVF